MKTYTEVQQKMTPVSMESQQLSIPILGQALLLVIGAALGIFIYYKRLLKRQ